MQQNMYKQHIVQQIICEANYFEATTFYYTFTTQAIIK